MIPTSLKTPLIEQALKTYEEAITKGNAAKTYYQSLADLYSDVVRRKNFLSKQMIIAVAEENVEMLNHYTDLTEALDKTLLQRLSQLR